MILVKTIYAANELRNYSYIIFNDQTGHAWVIDPYEAATFLDYIKKNGLVLKGILNTHQHWDHIRGNELLVKTFHAPVQKLNNSSTLVLDDNFFLETIDTPGHTSDHQVFLWKEGQNPLALFSGDTLFNSGVGNCHGGGDVNQLYESTMLLQTLPPSTILYPGHDYRRRNLEFALTLEPGNPDICRELKNLEGHRSEQLPPVTLGDEVKINPFLRLESEEIRQNVRKLCPPLPEVYQDRRELFINLRKLRDNW
jgi:hydroxyacylglutathione hydrolase